MSSFKVHSNPTEKYNILSKQMVCYIKLTLVFLVVCFPAGESTVAPGEETPAFTLGKTLNNMEKEKKFNIQIVCTLS